MKNLDLIVEVGTEEIPAGYLEPALDALKDRLGRALSNEKLGFENIKVWGTPNRMAAGVWGITPAQEDEESEVTGPPVSAAYDADGNPTKAAQGFARGQGVDVADLVTVKTKKGDYLGVKKTIKGRTASEVLSDLLPDLILGLPFPKTMRWGHGLVTFVRPIHWVLGVLDGKLLPFSLGEINASTHSRGHRFLSPDPVEILRPDEYEEKLARVSVIVSPAVRREAVEKEINRAVKETGGLTVLPDQDLVSEVANLIEQPSAICGGFDESFLQLPEQVLITAMREHQRYFAVVDSDGTLAARFVAVNNTKARDMDLVARGHERVLRARLEDARFHFKEDRKTPLSSRLEGLKKVVFHSKLGTSWEKVQRTRALAGFLADALAPELKQPLLRAAELAKCDLTTGLVGEFPSLQGVMGMIYAGLDNEDPDTATAIYEHYLPIKAGGQLPQSKLGALLSLADKIESISGCFSVGLAPTGASDPYALRRQALGIINIVLDGSWALPLEDVVDQALAGLADWAERPAAEIKADILEFFKLRMKNLLTGQGASTDGAEAVLSLHHKDIVAAAAKVKALEDLRSNPEFQDLAIAFKRVVNIIKKFGANEDCKPEMFTHEAEHSLYRAWQEAENQAKDLAGHSDWSGLLKQIKDLKPEVDRFFDDVLVDDPDPQIKRNRLALLTKVSDLFALVGDFSKIST